MLQHTFSQRLVITIVAGFAAACLFWVFRHVVSQSLWEMGSGWKESTQTTIPSPRR